MYALQKLCSTASLGSLPVEENDSNSESLKELMFEWNFALHHQFSLQWLL